MRILLGVGIAFLCGCGGGPREWVVDAGNPAAAAGDADSACHCTLAVRTSGTTPGFELFCGPGRVTLAGAQTWFGPGTDLLPGGPLNGGCAVGPLASGEGAPAGCCVPDPSL